jgi:predicted alpha/beta-fold hydrolase
MPEVSPDQRFFPAFVAAPGLSNPHLQTILSALVMPRSLDAGECVLVPLAGGSLDVRLHRAAGGAPRGAVLLLHGAGGSIDEAYVRRTAAKVAGAGLDAIRLNLRGAGDSIGATPAVLHGGLTEDIHAAVDHFRNLYPRLALLGFSLGGQIALKTACEWGASPPREVAAVVGISPALDLSRSTRFFDRPAAGLYRRVVMARLRAHYKRVRAALPEPLQRIDPASFRGASQYNAALVAPAFGFRDVDDYYEAASSLAELGAIRVPTLILHAVDDPVVPVLPALEARALARPSVRVEITERGGHIGFFASAPMPGEPDRFWAESRAKRFIEAAIDPRAPMDRESRTLPSRAPPARPHRP